MIESILFAVVTMLVLASVMGFILGWANKAFHVEIDPKQEAIQDVLPGANCGGCGYIGCNDYAEAVAANDCAVNLCPVGGPSCTQAIADIMGVEVTEAWPQRPVIHCHAHYEDRKGRHEYYGEQSCQAANMVAGVQGCTYGCLGFGDCYNACEYDAITIVRGLATIDYDNCVGCGACAPVCPRNIISIVPFKSEQIFVVGCSNQDFGKEVKDVCTLGCTGCSGCARVSEVIELQDNLPRINYEAYDPSMDFTASSDKCPRESLLWVGKPGAADLVATANLDTPEVAEVDFQTTVDHTDWRG